MPANAILGKQAVAKALAAHFFFIPIPPDFPVGVLF
jgi:hypothetical protein